jgi:beta-glucosidase
MSRLAACLALCSLVTAAHTQNGQQSAASAPYLNPSLSIEDRVSDLVGRMTLTEKIAQLHNNAPGIPRLNVPKFEYWSEGLHGVARKGYATNFPQAIGLGATWDAPLVREIGGIISTEARALHNASLQPGYEGPSADLTYWSPNINIFRDPRWGRGQETYGEDPYLTARMGVAFIGGMQGDDPKYLKVVATPKHYAVHSGPEPLRHKFNVDVKPHDLEDTYLPAFRASIAEAHAASIMCAYSAVDGVPACASKMLLQDYLRTSWKFQGFVVSDCDAIEDVSANHHYSPDEAHGAAVSLLAGTDMDCGGAYRSLNEAVSKKLIDESAIDAGLKNVLAVRFRLGLFDPPNSVVYDKISPAVVDSAEHRTVALRAARESIVLLKNAHDLLPLQSKIRSIAVVGPVAEDLEAVRGDYAGTLSDPVYPVEGIERQFGGHASIIYTQGASRTTGSYGPLPSYTLSPAGASGDGFGGLKAEYYNNANFDGSPVAVRIDRHIDFDWSLAKPVPGVGLRDYSVRWTGTFTAPSAGEYVFQANVHDCKSCKDHEQFKMFIDGKCVLDSSKYQTASSGKSSENASITFTDVQPHAIRYEYIHHKSDAGTTLSWKAPENILQGEAVKAANRADAVVAFVGITRREEDEGHDRTEIGLPETQEKMLEALYGTGKPVIVVLLNGSALSINSAPLHAAAILEAWYPGEQGGTAIAETLSGKNNPSGKLPVTFYQSLDQLPGFEDYSMNDRTYRYFKGKSLFPFGFGLSYSNFTYSNLKPSTSKLQAGESLSVDADVANNSDRDGDEVVELYLAPPSFPGAPRWSLQAFTRVSLAPHQTRHVHFNMDPRQLSFVNEYGSRAVRAGEYALYVGGGQPQGTLPVVSTKFSIRGSIDLPR